MGYKIKGALQKSKWVFIIFGILWVVLSIVLTTSITVSTVEAKQAKQSDVGGTFLTTFINNIGNVGENLEKSFQEEYSPTFWKVELRLTGILLICVVIGLIRSMPKNEYSGISKVVGMSFF